MCAEQLAACLATPFTGDERNLGEMIDAHVRRAMNEAEANTQLRCGSGLQRMLCTLALYMCGLSVDDSCMQLMLHSGWRLVVLVMCSFPCHSACMVLVSLAYYAISQSCSTLLGKGYMHSLRLIVDSARTLSKLELAQDA